ncbi:tyrosine-type recombinase/integrase [Herbidospora mongoliensis]|uniref:tyrosine-type recombinase/integrase n=1 Tax=Herbidospora mongoliensis TaxID=688067 RepID=UPI000ADFBABD|nr:tyrosine-type recombinase/integrase [Herbidospora mongoliensis]
MDQEEAERAFRVRINNDIDHPNLLFSETLEVKKCPRAWKAAKIIGRGDKETGELKKLSFTVEQFASRQTRGGYNFEDKPEHRWTCENEEIDALQAFLNGSLPETGVYIRVDNESMPSTVLNAIRQGDLSVSKVAGVLHVRRQIKKLGSEHIFALPKNDRERVVPLPEWTAEAIRRHVAAFPPLTCSPPWEKLNGKVQTHNLLVQWTDDRFIRARVYSELIWKPALVAVGVIPAPAKDANSRTRFTTSRKEGLHQLRHYYASVMLVGAVSVKELAEYLGHANPGFTLRVYAHLMPGSHDRARKAIDDRLFRPRLISHGTGTEQ